MGLTKLSEKCSKCPKKDTCDHKRMEAVAYLEPTLNPLAQPLAQPLIREYTPIIIHMGDYGDIHTSMEELAKEINKSFQINCTLNKS